MTTRVGIIGTGFMGGVHAGAWQATDAELVSILEHTTASRVGAMGQYGAEIFTDLDAFLDSVDIVDICVPTHLHSHFALAAAEAGKPTICEKPLTLTSAEGREVIEAFERRRLLLQVGQVLRFSPEYSAARDAVLSGAIGSLAVVRLSRLSFLPKRGRDSWFRDDKKSGGIAFDLMIHDLDYARWVAGEVHSVYTRTAVGGNGHAIAVLQHRNGVISHVEASWAQPSPTFRTAGELAGATGTLTFSSDASSPVVARLHEERVVTTGGGGNAFAANPFEIQLQHFLDILRDGATPILTAHDGLAAVRLAEAARESARLRQPVVLEEEGELS